ncbi:nucleotide-binding domain-containing protein [Porphyromonas pasteri]|nr:hypothetical protein [Porphyromonas pasteri]
MKESVMIFGVMSLAMPFPKESQWVYLKVNVFLFYIKIQSCLLRTCILINITEELIINCWITANGFKSAYLRDILRRFERINMIRSLDFFIESTTVEKSYKVFWKVRNVGDEAKRRNCLRGEILRLNKADDKRHETSNFRGSHHVECYIIKNDVVVARDRIDVPII